MMMQHGSPESAAERWRRLAPWLLVVAGVLVYVNTLPNAFVFDDTGYILENETIQSLANWPQIVKENPRWVADVTLALNWAAEGDEPRGYHLVNMVIHILAAVTLYGLVGRVVERRAKSEERGARSGEGRGKSEEGGARSGEGRGKSEEGRAKGDGPLTHSSPFALRSSLVAFAVAMLWLVHPLNTQAVTYVIQRHESLMGLFYLLTLYGVVRTAEAEAEAAGERGAWARWGWGAAAVAACLLGMSTKPVMVTAPVVALLLDRAFLAGSQREALRQQWLDQAPVEARWRRWLQMAVAGPLGMALRQRWWLHGALAATWVTLFFNGTFSGIAREGSSAGFGMELVTWWQYLLSQGEVILHYLRLAAWPWPLVLDYQWLPAAIVEDAGYRLAHVYLPCAVVAVLLGVSVYGLVRNTWWGFLGFSFFAVLSVTSSVLPIADLAMEHRMYLSLAALIALVVVGCDKALPRSREARVIAGGAAALAAVVLAGLTVQRNFEYRTGVSIWTTVTERRPLNPRGFHNLGQALGEAGREDEALAAYERAVEMVPSYADAHHNMGNIWMDRGRPARALERYQAAVKAGAGDAEHRYGLATALEALGRLEEARAQVDAAIELDPQLAKAYSLRGSLRARSGDTAGAIDDFQRAIELDPELTEAWYNLGLTRLREDEDARAAAALRQAIELDPRDPRPMRSLARLLATSEDASVRDGMAAMEILSLVRRLAGGWDVVTLDTLAAAHAEQGEFEQARALVQRAIELAARQGLPRPLIEEMEARRGLYERGEAYRE